jgi:TatA/E family protein of Tat protein translocase
MNFLGMGPMELLLIVVLALIVFGPQKLPEIMAQVGKAINDFRRATSQLTDEFNRTIQSELNEGRSVLEDTRATVTDMQTTVNSAMTLQAPARVAAPAAAPSTTTNGVPPEPYVEGFPETKITNGTAPAAPLADTSTAYAWQNPTESTPAQPVGGATEAHRIEPTTSDPIASPPAHGAAEQSPPSADESEKPASTPPVADPTPPRIDSTDKPELLPPY